jgi:hypothetical protein
MKTKDTQDKIYGLHYEGQLLTPKLWSEIKGRHYYGGMPKRLYYKLGTAKGVITYFPPEVQLKLTVVEYVPGAVVHNVQP